MKRQFLHWQRGVALPVMFIMLMVMLVGSIYLMRSTNSTTLTTANLAYDNAMSRAADAGLHEGFQWLSTTAQTGKAALDIDDPVHGYKATLDTTQQVNDPGFWQGSATTTDTEHRTVEYIVHRMCSLPGNYASAAPANTCVQTSAPATGGSATQVGSSMATGSPSFMGNPQVHYVITSRIYGARGGNVVNQAVVMIGV